MEVLAEVVVSAEVAARQEVAVEVVGDDNWLHLNCRQTKTVE